MQNQNLDAARIENTARLVGAIFGGLFVGCICGLLPLYIGKRIGRMRLGVAGFFTCLVSGGVFGLLLALPVMILFTIVMLIIGRPASKQSLPPNTALEPTAAAPSVSTAPSNSTAAGESTPVSGGGGSAFGR